jgi:hypothetical protein
MISFGPSSSRCDICHRPQAAGFFHTITRPEFSVHDPRSPTPPVLYLAWHTYISSAQGRTFYVSGVPDALLQCRCDSVPHARLARSCFHQVDQVPLSSKYTFLFDGIIIADCGRYFRLPSRRFSETLHPLSS